MWLFQILHLSNSTLPLKASSIKMQPLRPELHNWINFITFKRRCAPLLPYAVIPEAGISLFILEAKEQHLLHECQPGLLAVPLLLLFFLNCIFIHLRNRFWFRDSHTKITMSEGLTSSVLGWRRLCTSPSPLSIIMITLSERKNAKISILGDYQCVLFLKYISPRREGRDQLVWIVPRSTRRGAAEKAWTNWQTQRPLQLHLTHDSHSLVV